jgi:ATP-binding cassette, subfamily B, multidrug efflux pump
MSTKQKTQTLLSYFFRYKGWFFVGFLALFFTNALQFLLPRSLGWFTDALVGSKKPVPPSTSYLSSLLRPVFAPIEQWVKETALSGYWRIFVFFVVISLIVLAARVISRLVIFYAGRLIEYDLRQDIFAQLLRLPPSYYRRTSLGDILSRTSNDLAAVRLIFGPGLLNVVNTTIVFITGLPLLLFISPKLTLAAFAPFPFILLGVVFVIRRMFKANVQTQVKLAELSARAEETISGVTVVQSYAREDAFTRRFAANGKEYIAASMDLVKMRGILGPMVGTFGGFGVAFAFWIGGEEVIAGRMGFGDLLTFQATFTLIAWPIAALGFVISIFERGRAAYTRISSLLAEVPTLLDPEHPDTAPTNGDLEVKNLSCGYGDQKILHDVSFSVPAGDCLGIVGATGSGKSTLVMALARLLEVAPNTIFLGGKDVTTLRLRDVRTRISLVQQEAFLFADTIAENLAFGLGGDNKDSREGIKEAARTARFMQDIDGFPQGFDTEVGERGVQLSGGQKQRASLARAILRPSDILILDDSLSAIDAYTESEILSELPKMSKGKSLLIVSHRIAAVRHANKIIVLERGVIVEQGTHQELLAKKGRYAELDRLQRLKEELKELEQGA